MKTVLNVAKKTRNSSFPSFNKCHAIAKNLEPYTIATRRFLHEIPELGWEEEKTLSFIKQEIYTAIQKSELHFEVTEAEGGLWVDLTMDVGLPRLLFRADIDGLPIQEETGLPFSSIHPGKMHACGHDCHAAMLLSAFQAIAQGLIMPETNLRFVWQRAEEFLEQRSGGERLVEEGALISVDHVFALHISSTTEAGTFSSRPGLMMANTAQLHFGIECSGGHVMHPHIGSNAIHIMMDIHNALRGIERCYFNSEEPIAFVPSIAKAGVASNIRPSSAELCYALRNFLPLKERDAFVYAVKDRISLLIKSYLTASLSYFHYISGYPPLVTNPTSYTFVKHLLKDAGFNTQKAPLLFAGEDFTYYLNEVPGSFWLLGARQGLGADHHTSYFNPDENQLWRGTAFWLLLSQTVPPKTT